MNNENELREKFIAAAICLMQRLRLKEESRLEEQPLCKIQKASGRLALEICQQPQALSYLENPTKRRPPWIQATVHVDTVNHPANQYLRWLMLKLDIRIEEAKGIMHIAQHPLNDTALQIILNDPLYANLHQIGTRLLSVRNSHG